MVNLPWIYQCINPSFSPLDRFCLLCWIVSNQSMLVSYYHDPGGGLTHVSFSNLTNIFRMGWNKRQIGILEYSHEGINHQIQGSVSVKMKVSLLSHEVSCLHTITPASSPFLVDTKHPKHIARWRISLAFGLGFGRDQWGRHNGKQWYFSMVMTPPFAKNLHPPLPTHVACLCQ